MGKGKLKKTVITVWKVQKITSLSCNEASSTRKRQHLHRIMTLRYQKSVTMSCLISQYDTTLIYCPVLVRCNLNLATVFSVFLPKAWLLIACTETSDNQWLYHQCGPDQLFTLCPDLESVSPRSFGLQNLVCRATKWQELVFFNASAVPVFLPASCFVHIDL